MIRVSSNALAACLTAGLLASAIGTASAKEYPKCSRNHPGRTDRAARLLQDGDTEVCKSIAKHVVGYSIKKYGLDGVITDDQIRAARSEIYDFLKWKLGNPSAVAAQWVSAGYRHFDKAYSDEAGAAALGSGLPGPGTNLVLPRQLSEWLKAKVDSVGMETEAGPSLCAQISGGSDNGGAQPTSTGSEGEEGDAGSALMGVGCQLTLVAVKEAIKLAIDRIGISVGAGRSWDIPNASVELAVYARLHPVKKGRVGPVALKQTAPATKGKTSSTISTGR